MKKAVLFSIICALFISSQTYANLAPGTTIADYLPVISGDALTDPGTGFTYQIQSIDEFEVEESKYKWKGQAVLDTGAGTITLEELEFDPDPFVTNTVLITNLTALTQVYTVTTTLPTVFPVSPNFIRGSVTVALLDDAANGATFSTAPGWPIYTALIDGFAVKTET